MIKQKSRRDERERIKMETSIVNNSAELRCFLKNEGLISKGRKSNRIEREEKKGRKKKRHFSN